MNCISSFVSLFYSLFSFLSFVFLLIFLFLPLLILPSFLLCFSHILCDIHIIFWSLLLNLINPNCGLLSPLAVFNMNLFLIQFIFPFSLLVSCITHHFCKLTYILYSCILFCFVCSWLCSDCLPMGVLYVCT